MTSGDQSTYSQSGVDAHAARRGLSRLGQYVSATLRHRDTYSTGRPIRGLGYYANVLDIGNGQGLAVCADGVGTKIMVAEAVGRYDGIPIDCIAMNVNDLICVGADPLAMLDYLAVGVIDDDVMEQLGRGLLEGARQSGITIPGGEIAQVKDMLRGSGPTQGLDLVGTAMGLVPLEKVLFGQTVAAKDAVIGLNSSGIHSNGFTLARRVLAPTDAHYQHHEESFGRTIGEELLEPTALYVAFARALFAEDLPLHALCHITGDGFANLTRVEAKVGFHLDNLPTPHPVFQLIQERGSITNAEMYSVYNMGVGLCVILPEAHVDTVHAIAKANGFRSWRVGTVTDEDAVVRIPQHRLVTKNGELVAE